MKNNIVLWFLAALIIVGFGGCYNTTTKWKQAEAKTLLEKQGFTEIQTSDALWKSSFVCSSSDIFAVDFAAKSVNGSQVNGTVCSGIFKGQTIRF